MEGGTLLPLLLLLLRGSHGLLDLCCLFTTHYLIATHYLFISQVHLSLTVYLSLTTQTLQRLPLTRSTYTILLLVLSLSALPGGNVADEPFSTRECYEMALLLIPTLASGWSGLGGAGGGTVASTTFSEKQCYLKALQTDPHHADALSCLGVEGHSLAVDLSLALHFGIP